MDDVRILIADSDEAFGRSTTELLTEEGYRCDLAQSAAHAIAALDKEGFDLVIADVNMPGNKALEIVRKADAGKEQLPVILVTEEPSVESAVQSIPLPVTAYLVKPLNPGELLSEIKVAVERSRILSAIARRTEEVLQWRDELKELQNYVRTTRSEGKNVAVARFQAYTLKNITSSLLDLKLINDVLILSRDTPNRRLAEFVVATKETIDILQMSKMAFKSKELATHRKYLENLLRAEE